MSAKGSGTQGYRYYMSLLSGLCRGPIDELIEINIGDKSAWNGHACSNLPQYIDAPELFGGDDKEGGVQGPFNVFMGEDDQVLPGAANGLPDVRASMGGLVSQMRGVVTVWFDGMVAAMNPYLKTWKFRVRRSTKGWHGGVAWYPDKATILLGGDTLSVADNSPIDFPVVENEDGTFTITLDRNMAAGDTFTINGLEIEVVDDDPADFQIKKGTNRPNSIARLGNYINAHSTTFKASVSYTSTQITITANVAASQVFAMNPAHMIYQCYTDPLWGRGYRTSDIDENSFIYAANRFCSEMFGLALIWYRKEEIETFIQKIVDLVGAITYTDRESGKLAIKLIRNDYDVNTIPFFTPETGLLAITEDDSASSDNSYNEIIGKSRDPVTNLDFQMRAQNLAAYQSQGAPASLDQDYKGIPTKALLARVLTRDLRAMSSGLKKYTVMLDRRAWRITPGSVIRISSPGRGLANVVLRVGEIDDSDMANGAIKVKAAIDVFGLPDTTYIDVVDNGWIAPSQVAVPAADERLIEIGYRDLYRIAGATEAQAAEPTSAYIGQLAIPPNTTSLEYDLLTKAEGEPEYVDRGRGPFTGNVLLAADIAPLDTTATVKSAVMFDEDNEEQALLIGDELVRLDTYDPDTNEITITRGVADTIPQAHAANDTLWTIDDDLVTDRITYAEGETVFAKVLTRTTEQLLDPALAEEQEIELVARHTRPYPPADVRVDGISVFGTYGILPEPVLTWSHRNRLTQADALTGHGAASITPEAGQTYTIRVYDADGVTLLRTVDAIAAATWTYTALMQGEDGSPSSVYFELESERDGYASWQHYRFRVVISGGWGYGWGDNWGGG